MGSGPTLWVSCSLLDRGAATGLCRPHSATYRPRGGATPRACRKPAPLRRLLLASRRRRRPLPTTHLRASPRRHSRPLSQRVWCQLTRLLSPSLMTQLPSPWAGKKRRCEAHGRWAGATRCAQPDLRSPAASGRTTGSVADRAGPQVRGPRGYPSALRSEGNWNHWGPKRGAGGGGWGRESLK